MSKRILFVDDEALVLDGLQRMLRPLRAEWDMEFLDSGEHALSRMAQVPFDVVVSDMRMPGMNGAELLSQVMQRHPKAVRLILSGEADKELILHCVGSTHQFLAKPCDPEAIRAILRRAAITHDAMQDESLKQLVGRMNHLPSIPSIYAEMVTALNDPDVELATIGAIVSRDLALTAKILNLVNSAFFGLRHEVANPTEAASYLGLDTLRSLILLVGAFAPNDQVDVTEFSLHALWAHSLATAGAAKVIAQLEGADHALVDAAFVAGLLHDTGKLVLAANFPAHYAEMLALIGCGADGGAAAEQQVFGATHAQVGGYLLGLWGLPLPVVEAVSFHHQPALAAEKLFSPLTAVHVANALVQVADGAAEENADLPLDGGYLAALGLTDRVPVWRNQLRNETESLKTS